jgi:hypothetical protein
MDFHAAGFPVYMSIPLLLGPPSHTAIGTSNTRFRSVRSVLHLADASRLVFLGSPCWPGPGCVHSLSVKLLNTNLSFEAQGQWRRSVQSCGESQC